MTLMLSRDSVATNILYNVDSVDLVMMNLTGSLTMLFDGDGVIDEVFKEGPS